MHVDALKHFIINTKTEQRGLYYTLAVQNALKLGTPWYASVSLPNTALRIARKLIGLGTKRDAKNCAPFHQLTSVEATYRQVRVEVL
jgi:hypothetical protein